MSTRATRALRLAASTRLAAVLITALAVLTLLGVLVPQEAYLGSVRMEEFRSSAPALAAAFEALGLDHVYSGIPFAITLSLLALNTLACTVQRLIAHRKTLSGRAPRVRSVTTTQAGRAVDEARAELTAAGWRVTDREDGVTARKGRSGFWGSMLFHASLLVIMAGAVASALTQFSGYMLIAEGQSVVDAREAYLSVSGEPRVGDAFTGARLTLESMRFEYEDDEVIWAGAAMSGADLDGRLKSFEARVNYPFELAGKSYLLMDSGYVADISVESDGVTRSLLVNLAEETPYGWQDAIAVPQAGGSPLEIGLVAAPVALAAGEELPVEKYDIVDPRLAVGLASAPAEMTVLAAGESAMPAPEVRVTFNGLRLWSRFLVRKDPFRWVVYAGFWLAVIGLTWRFFVPERRMSVVETADGFDVGYSVRPWRGIMLPSDRDLIRIMTGPTERQDGGR